MKKGSLFLFSALLSLLFLPSVVSAKEINVKNTEKIQDIINTSTTGDVLILEDGSYTENLIIDKNLTLKGTSMDNTIIEGSIVISADVTLDTLTLQGTSSELIDINGKQNGIVNISNLIIKYKNYTDNDYGLENSISGIRLSKNSDGTKLNVNNTKIYAQYGIWINGEKNNLKIENSQITGWSALDISNGTTSLETEKNNNIDVSNSILTGISYKEENVGNNYGTIVIGGQENLNLNITKSTIQNKINTLNQQDLIMFSDVYLTNKNVMITITDSNLKNTDTSGNSYVYNWMNIENSKNKNSNIIVNSNVKIESLEENINKEIDGYINLTISTNKETSLMKVAEGSTIGQPIAPQIEGYNFDGWYIDQEYKNKFDFTKQLTENTTIIAKFSKIETNEENTKKSNPDTADINLPVLITLSNLSLTGIMFAMKQRILRSM